MAKTTILPFIRELGIVLIVLWSLGIKAQTNNSATLIWDNQVGCIEYDYDGRDPKNGFVFDENVENRSSLYADGKRVLHQKLLVR